MSRRAVRAFIATGVLTVAIVASGCSSGRPDANVPLDPTYLATSPEKDKLDFRVYFCDFREDDAPVMEQAWKEMADRPREAAPWEDNGLRIASTDATGAKVVKALLRRAGLFQVKRQQFVMAPMASFEVIVGRQSLSGGVVYATRESTVYKEVPAVQLSLKITPILDRESKRFSVAPFFYSGPGRSEPVELVGVNATFDYKEGGMIMFGPVAVPREMRLGSGLYEARSDGRWGMFVVIEPRLSY
jgi:hypothetical protein